MTRAVLRNAYDATRASLDALDDPAALARFDEIANEAEQAGWVGLALDARLAKLAAKPSRADANKRARDAERLGFRAVGRRARALAR